MEASLLLAEQKENKNPPRSAPGVVYVVAAKALLP